MEGVGIGEQPLYLGIVDKLEAESHAVAKAVRLHETLDRGSVQRACRRRGRRRDGAIVAASGITPSVTDQRPATCTLTSESGEESGGLRGAPPTGIATGLRLWRAAHVVCWQIETAGSTPIAATRFWACWVWTMTASTACSSSHMAVPHQPALPALIRIAVVQNVLPRARDVAASELPYGSIVGMGDHWKWAIPGL